MTEDFRTAKIKQLEAVALKEKAEADRIKLEVLKGEKDLESPFYKQSWFIKALVAGILVFAFLIGYVELIFMPTQERMKNEVDTAKYILDRREVQFAAEKAELKLLLEKTKFEGEKANATLTAAKAQLDKADKSILQLQEKILILESGDFSDDKIESIKSNIEQNLKENKYLREQSQNLVLGLENIKSELQETIDVQENVQGWIYVGHYPNNEWGYKNINIEANKLPAKNKEYIINKDLNVRSKWPTFSFTGYKFGRIVGHLSAGQKIKVIGTPREVGFSKVWVEVKLVNE